MEEEEGIFRKVAGALREHLESLGKTTGLPAELWADFEYQLDKETLGLTRDRVDMEEGEQI